MNLPRLLVSRRHGGSSRCHHRSLSRVRGGIRYVLWLTRYALTATAVEHLRRVEEGAKTVDSLGEAEAVGSLGGAVSPQTPASLLLGPLGPPPRSYPHAASCSLPRGTSAVDPDLHSLKTCLPYFCAF